MMSDSYRVQVTVFAKWHQVMILRWPDEVPLLHWRASERCHRDRTTSEQSVTNKGDEEKHKVVEEGSGGAYRL